MKRVIAASVLALVASSSAFAARTHHVKPHFTKLGQFVAGHIQTNLDRIKINNWSTSGNMNPFTGKRGYKKCVPRSLASKHSVTHPLLLPSHVY